MHFLRGSLLSLFFQCLQAALPFLMKLVENNHISKAKLLRSYNTNN